VRRVGPYGTLALVKFYAERPAAALRQVITDVLIVVWVYGWIRLALGLYHAIEKLAGPGRTLAGAGDQMAGQLRDVSGKINRVPGVGNDLAAPFRRAGDAAQGVADAGREQQTFVHDAALTMAIALVVLPLGLVLFWLLPRRLRWVRRASAAARLRGGTVGKDLLALRALAGQPLTRLTRLDPDIAAAWRRGDPVAVDRLAALELTTLGLRAPR
jgi:hypothetical protein